MFELCYEPISVNEMLDTMKPDWVSKHKVEYVAQVSAFDIETTSFYDGDNKRATMYVWQFGYDGRVCMGRTWPEFVGLLARISSQLDLSTNRRLIVYVHNLSFEFQFMRKWFKWEKVFATDKREPLFAVASLGIEFRDSLILSGYSLAKLGDQLQKYKVRKMVGDLDYSLPRNCKTPLTDKEIGYCVNDVLVVMAYVQELCEREGGIHKLPYTRTGFVRNKARKECFRLDGHRRNMKYLSMIKSLTINDIAEFDMLRRAFQGGFTHANAAYSRQITRNVGSFDFTSSYPTVMLTEQFPMSRGRLVTISGKEEFEYLLDNYCCVFDIELFGVHPKMLNASPISASKCAGLENCVYNNGRVYSADHLYTTITNVDYRVYQQFYSWDKAVVNTVMVYRKDYLPKEFLKTIIDLYQNKTQLKGVEGKETEYLVSKEMLNATYGMAVTNPLKDENLYENDTWETKEYSETERAELLYEYNTNPQRFLFYPWGVFVTAYARRNLFSGILEMGADFVYSDTDSIKAMNWRDHMGYIEEYNRDITDKAKEMCRHYGFDVDSLCPKTVKGVPKPIGVWDFEEEYSRFKSLGAKRYLGELDGKLLLTVSGLNKKVAVPYMTELFGSNDGVFDGFDFGLNIPAGHTGKLLHTYIDEPMAGNLVDYMGNSCDYMEFSGTHLEPAGYFMSEVTAYINFMQGIKEIRK